MVTSPINVVERGLLCDICTSLTGSQEGLAFLFSKDGLKHHSKANFEASASHGCPCCIMLLEKALEEGAGWSGSSEDWDPRIVALDGQGKPVRVPPSGNNVFGQDNICTLRYKRQAWNDTAVIDLFVSNTPRKCIYSRPDLTLG